MFVRNLTLISMLTTLSIGVAVAPAALAQDEDAAACEEGCYDSEDTCLEVCFDANDPDTCNDECTDAVDHCLDRCDEE